MNYQDGGKPPPALKAGGGPKFEQLPGQLSVGRFNQDGPHSQAALDVDSILDDLKFDLLVETADLAIHHAERVRDAALGNDRDRARLHACQLSRCVKSMLITIGELCRKPA
jgi:hypothetical protein